MPAIHIRDLSKTYTIFEREAGIGAALRGLLRRRKREVLAVDHISFDVEPGEIVGFLGPNGAGKTTTLKMLSGLLYPSGGEISVLGHQPSRRENAYLNQIALVMGQRNQLAWDIPAVDTYELFRAIYRIPPDVYRRTLDEMVDLLEIGDLIRKPVRNLSLGERMKCEIAGALLHQPKVLFLDEPTLGLDVVAQRRIRSFMHEYNRRHNATIMLTSHYMADVEALAQRVVVIHHGKMLYDGLLSDLVERFALHKTLVVRADTDLGDLSAYGQVVQQQAGEITLRVPKHAIAAVTGQLLAALPISDLSIIDPPVDELIELIFAEPERMLVEAELS